MMKILNAEQIRMADAYTIENEPIASIDLMERAAVNCSNWIIAHANANQAIHVISGMGNNGGDGLALGRLLHESGYEVVVSIINHKENFSPDCETNFNRLEDLQVSINRIDHAQELTIPKEGIILDAILGSGLTRPTSGLLKEIIVAINSSHNEVIAVDIPSGLYCTDNNSNDPTGIIRADHTLSLELPKLAMMLSDNQNFVGKMHIIPIGLDQQYIQKQESRYYYLQRTDLSVRMREKYSHKGSYGHGLLVAGSKGKMGAAILAARASLRSGIGLVTSHIPGCGYDLMQVAVPEAMVVADSNHNFISDTVSTNERTMAVGPGIGTHDLTVKMLRNLITSLKNPMILDADALNILSANPQWLRLLPKESILTPHPGEFKRLVGLYDDDLEKIEKQSSLSEKYSIYIILKGAHTSVSTPDGKLIFNSTGNPGMATAGSGDVLTGILCGLLAQGYDPMMACLLGVYIHGMAGDLAAQEIGMESMIASDIVDRIAVVFRELSPSC